MTVLRARAALKSAAEVAACKSGLTAVARWSHRQRTIILAYHNIVPTGESAAGDLSLHLPQAEFARQLDELMATHTVISLPEITRRWSDRRPRAVITFDDAYRGAIRAGVDELVKRSLPATFFVAPAFVGGKSFWWDVVADGKSAGLPGHARSHGINALQGKDAVVRKWANDHSLAIRDVPAHQTAASVEELKSVAANGLITMGSHSWSHANLARLDDTELNSELRTSLEWLRSSLPCVIPWVSYPYGLSSSAARAAAAEAGYRGAFLISGGWLGAVDDQTRFSLPRVNIPAGLSLRGFEIRVSGLMS